MSKPVRRKWTLAETLAVLLLYDRVPYGSFVSSNPDIIAYAKRIDRSPSAVAMKLSNFANQDPKHAERGVSGLKNVSALDKQIMAEYLANPKQVLALAQAADGIV